jgi:hypothetical protein
VAKVQHKPIKSQRKGSNKKSKRQPKGSHGLAHRTVRCAIRQCSVHHRTVSGAPGSCTPNLPPSGIWGGRSAIIHRTVWCAKRSNGRPRQRSLHRYSETLQCRLRAQSQSRRQMAHWTVNRTCSVHHRTVRWPTCQKLQRSNPNGLVMWLAHRTVSGGAPDCPVCHTTEALTNGPFGGWGYKYPQPPL